MLAQARQPWQAGMFTAMTMTFMPLLAPTNQMVYDTVQFYNGTVEETSLEPIRVGDPAEIKLMGYRQIVRGHVNNIDRGIIVANAQPNGQGLANVNPIFTWVRMAQRIPVRVRIDEVPEGVVLAAGMTATVQIDTQPRSPAN